MHCDFCNNNNNNNNNNSNENINYYLFIIIFYFLFYLLKLHLISLYLAPYKFTKFHFAQYLILFNIIMELLSILLYIAYNVCILCNVLF